MDVGGIQFTLMGSLPENLIILKFKERCYVMSKKTGHILEVRNFLNTKRQQLTALYDVDTGNLVQAAGQIIIPVTQQGRVVSMHPVSFDIPDVSSVEEAYAKFDKLADVAVAQEQKRMYDAVKPKVEAAPPGLKVR